jgi:allantoinase
MIPTQRLEYSASIDREPLKLPRGIRMIVWPIVNVEVWDIARPMPRQALPPPTGITQLPDVPHWAWHEYGNRVGFWRMKAVLDRLKITPSLSVNARVCEDYPRIAQACLDAGWEFMGHSYDQRPIHLEPNQRATIRKAVKVIRDFTGKQPLGWLGPGFTQTLDTPEHLAEAGIRYICDWPIDDEPVEIKTKKGPLLSLPYSIELNDISIMIVRSQPAKEFYTRCMDHFDRLYAESKHSAKIMSIAVHPYISGVPYRIKYFEQVFETLRKKPGVAFWTGEQIMDWYLSTQKKAGKKR